MRSAQPLAELLDQAAQLVGDVDEPQWSSGLSRLARRLRAATDAETHHEVVEDVLSIYAGMGSFNDLVLQDATGVRPEQAELDRLRHSIHEAATEQRAGQAAGGGVDHHRQEHG